MHTSQKEVGLHGSLQLPNSCGGTQGSNNLTNQEFPGRDTGCQGQESY
jgi:hypothetical protein